jgi:hypothetical protein
MKNSISNNSNSYSKTLTNCSIFSNSIFFDFNLLLNCKLTGTGLQSIVDRELLHADINNENNNSSSHRLEIIVVRWSPIVWMGHLHVICVQIFDNIYDCNCSFDGKDGEQYVRIAIKTKKKKKK